MTSLVFFHRNVKESLMMSLKNLDTSRAGPSSAVGPVKPCISPPMARLSEARHGL